MREHTQVRRWTLVPRGSSRAFTAPEFHKLTAVAPAPEGFGNHDNTRRAYRNDLADN